MVNCPSCGAPVDLHLDNCPYCGTSIPKEEKKNETPTTQTVVTNIYNINQSEKRVKKYDRNKTTAAILAFCLGAFGADDFYLGDKRKGRRRLFGTIIWGTLTIGIWVIIANVAAFIRMIKYLSLSDTEFDDKYNY